MDFDSIVGMVVAVAALSLLIAVVFWSRRAIHRIARTGPKSARHILHERNGDNTHA